MNLKSENYMSIQSQRFKFIVLFCEFMFLDDAFLFRHWIMFIDAFQFPGQGVQFTYFLHFVLLMKCFISNSSSISITIWFDHAIIVGRYSIII